MLRHIKNSHKNIRKVNILTISKKESILGFGIIIILLLSIFLTSQSFKFFRVEL